MTVVIVQPRRRLVTSGNLDAESFFILMRSGVGVYHRAALRADPLAASRKMGRASGASWFETAQARLLTMGSNSHQSEITLAKTGGYHQGP